MRSEELARPASVDETEGELLLRPLLQPAYRFAYMMLRDRTAAEDAVQEAALKSWRKMATLRAGQDPLPWFLGFVANECRNARRSRWRSVLPLVAELPAAQDKSSNDPDLIRALARLPHRDRLVVLMFYYLDMPLADVARATGSREAAVRSRLYRAVAALRRHLSSGGTR